MSASAAPRKPIRGDLALAPVAELLRMVESQEATGRVRFDTELGHAEVAVMAGQMVDARMGELRGRAALFRLLGIVDGRFEVVYEPVAARPAIFPSVSQLLSERSRRTLEWRKLCEKAPPLSAVLMLSEAGRAVRDNEESLDDTRTLFRLVDGQRALSDIIGQSGLDAVDALTLIVSALENGQLTHGAAVHSLFPLANTSARGEPVSIMPAKAAPLFPVSAPTHPSEPGTLRKMTMVGMGAPVADPPRAPERTTAEVRRIINIDAPRGESPGTAAAAPEAPRASPSDAPPAAAAQPAVPGVPAAGAVADSSIMPIAGAAETGRRFIGRFEILSQIGRGGMGSVFLARLTSEGGFRRLFAVKLLRSHLAQNSEAADRFLEEARLAGQIHHPNVVSVVDAGLHGEQPYLVMDYVEGCSFRQLLSTREDERRAELVLPVLMDALAGLNAAHTLIGEDGQPLRLVHCDVSPENLLVGIDGTCRLTDFGVARGAGRRARGEAAHGKPSYCSPEQASRSHVDHRADLFSMGVVLYQALTGVKPFDAPTAEETLRQVCSKHIDPPSTVGLRPTPSLDFVCMKALERSPERRYASAEEMLSDLRRIALRENLLGSPADIAAWVRESVGRELAQRRLAVLDAARSSSVHAPIAYSPRPPEPREPAAALNSQSPPRESAPARAPDASPAELPPKPKTFQSDPPDSGIPGERTIALPPESEMKGSRATRWALVTASVLAAFAVLVTLLWPNAVSKMFRLNTEGFTSRGVPGGGSARPVADPAPDPSASPAPSIAGDAPLQEEVHVQ